MLGLSLVKTMTKYFKLVFLIKEYQFNDYHEICHLSTFFHFLHLLKHLHAGHQDSVSSLSFSTDGQLIASGSLDGVVKVWDVVKEDLKCTLEGPTGGIEVIFEKLCW